MSNGDGDLPAIGFIGLENVGSPMAANLIAAGYKLTVDDVRRDSADDLITSGAQWAETPAAVAANSKVIFLSLPGPAEVEEVVSGANGVLEGATSGATIVDLSTNSPTTVRALAAQAVRLGVELLDAPVSGGVAGAQRGSLTAIVGGTAAAVERLRPMLECIGEQIFHVGEAGVGNVAKLINNMLAIINMMTTAEALVLGARAGIDPVVLRDVVTKCSGTSRIFEHGSRNILADRLPPSFTVALGTKDLSLATSMADELGVDLPVGAHAAEVLREYRDGGLAHEDMFATVRALEEQAGVVVRGLAPDA